jgi:hypothetical protein
MDAKRRLNLRGENELSIGSDGGYLALHDIHHKSAH